MVKATAALGQAKEAVGADEATRDGHDKSAAELEATKVLYLFYLYAFIYRGGGL